MEKLYTTMEIAELYGNISANLITNVWIPQGLKHIRGKRKGYLYKISWVEEFIEQQANQSSDNKFDIKSQRKICNIKIT